MPCTEAYKEHIEYTFNAFCRVVIHYAAINAWRDRDKRRQREISFEYLTEEKFYPFSTTDKYFIDPCKQYPVTICGQMPFSFYGFCTNYVIYGNNRKDFFGSFNYGHSLK